MKKYIIFLQIKNTIIENIFCTLKKHHEEILYFLQIKNTIIENILFNLKQHHEGINYFLRIKNTLVIVQKVVTLSYIVILLIHH